jgi:predicted amidohydrolase
MIQRRELLLSSATAALGVLAGAKAVGKSSDDDVVGKSSDDVKEPAIADYEAVPLAVDEVGVTAAQMNPVPVDSAHPNVGKRENLQRLLTFCDQAQSFGGKANLLVFPEFSITGYDFTWQTKDFLDVALDLEGEEIQAIGKKAKERDMYIVFASHIKDQDWPGHYFNCSLMVGPNGKLIHKHWKAHGSGPVGEYATTVHEVMDEFIERYGVDAVWPVARTPIGNIATYTCSEGFSPETARAFAFKGAEILCRCIGGGGHANKCGKYRLQFRADCAASNLYGVYANGGSGVSFKGLPPPDNGWGGGSMIVDYYGRILNEAQDSREGTIFEKIPIAAHRKSRKRPNLRSELYALGYEETPGKYPANLYSDYGMPENAMAAMKLAAKHARY